ncbi:MAG: hypothetical protein HC922_08425 [Leptolyngbyaceae cyanobacterium SM2_3_12]|nr:hypothetical protein [Leptolyngbyaceae cyanobacterium SM2_3_12]
MALDPVGKALTRVPRREVAQNASAPPPINRRAAPGQESGGFLKYHSGASFKAILPCHFSKERWVRVLLNET